ncbi:MAG: hypothetical protein CM1200mP15_05550 [Dehalococcoidia bacterium]|nr:MAG: hypothetical protein CM1200mP15_05550 [Dehalococcoidia bacterium]
MYCVWGPVERSLTVETGESDRKPIWGFFVRAAFDLLSECIAQSKG